MDGWYWVSSAGNRVDTQALLAACRHLDSALQGLRSARIALLETSLGWQPGGLGATWSELLGTPLGGELSEVSALAARLGWQVREDLQGLLLRVDQHADWLGRAAAIYATAESDAAALAQVCSARDALGCPVNFGSGGVGAVGLVGALPGYVASFRRSAPNSGLTALSAQAHLSAIFGGRDRFQARAVEAAQWWSRMGELGSGAQVGVAVMSPRGKVQVFGRDGEPLGTSGPGVQAALARLTATPPSQEGAAATPLSVSELLGRIEDSAGGGQVGEVQVLRHQGSGGTSWTVVVKGTQEWAPGSNNPQDMESNLQTVAAVPSAQKQAVEKVMEVAGIGPGEPVELVGHSQGGAVALAIASTPAVRRRFNVVSVLTAGSPTGGIEAPENAAEPPVQVLNLENLSDLVPALDAASAGTQHSVTVHFDDSDLPVPENATAHSLETYVAAAERIERSRGPMAGEMAEWNRTRVETLGLGGSVTSTAAFYRTTRVREG